MANYPKPTTPVRGFPPPIRVQLQPHSRDPRARPGARTQSTTHGRWLAAGGLTATIVGFAAVLWSDGRFTPAIGTVQAVLAKSAAATAPTNGDDRAALYLARSTLMALDDANRTGNYSVLRLLGSPAFQSANSPERLADVFAATRRNELDLSVAALGHPRWSTQPGVGQDRLLRLTGTYDLAGADLRFAIAFEPAEGAWRLHEIQVGVEPVIRAADVVGSR